MQVNFPDLINRLWKDKSNVLRPYFFPETSSIPLVANDTYLRLRLARIFLRDRRVLFQTKFPVVNTNMSFAGPNGKVETQFVTRPKVSGDENKAGLDKVVVLDQTVLGPVVYRGGDVEVVLGLFSAPADDWAKRFLSLAEGISALTLNAPLITAVSMAGAVKTSLDNALGGGEEGLDLKLGMNIALKENATPNDSTPLAPGHLAMIAAPASEIEGSSLSFVEGELMSGGKIYDAHDYIVLAIEVSDTRQDWLSLGYADAWNKLMKVTRTAVDREEFIAEYYAFIGLIQASDSLTEADRSRIAAHTLDTMDPIREARSANADKLAQMKDLDAILNAPEPTFDVDPALPNGPVRLLTTTEMMEVGRQRFSLEP